MPRLQAAMDMIHLGNIQNCRRLAGADKKGVLVLEQSSGLEACLNPELPCLLSGVLALPQMREKTIMPTNKS